MTHDPSLTVPPDPAAATGEQQCPRCRQAWWGPGALSRVCAVRICPDCGTQEAIEQWQARACTPQRDWPVTPENPENPPPSLTQMGHVLNQIEAAGMACDRMPSGEFLVSLICTLGGRQYQTIVCRRHRAWVAVYTHAGDGAIGPVIAPSDLRHLAVFIVDGHLAGLDVDDSRVQDTLISTDCDPERAAEMLRRPPHSGSAQRRRARHRPKRHR